MSTASASLAFAAVETVEPSCTPEPIRVDRSTRVAVVASVPGLLGRGLGLGPRRPPRARRLKEPLTAAEALPVESRIVWRAGAVAFR
jgi:hypothetical protein